MEERLASCPAPLLPLSSRCPLLLRLDSQLMKSPKVEEKGPFVPILVSPARARESLGPFNKQAAKPRGAGTLVPRPASVGPRLRFHPPILALH